MSLLSEDRESFRLPVDRTDETDFFSFQGSVGPNGENRREDVIKAQTLLARTGDFQSPFEVPTGWPSSDLFKGIKAFQKRHGKQPDGTLLPIPPGGVDQNGIGESLYALHGELGNRFAGQTAPTPQQVDAHYEDQARFRNTVAEGAVSASRQLQAAVMSDVPDTAPPAWGDGRQVAQADAAAGATPDASPETGHAAPKPKPMPLPGFKKDYFAQPANEGAWDQSQSALQQQLPDSPGLRGALGRIYAEEGGRIRDPNDTAVGGLTAGTLRELQEKGLLPGLSKNATPQSLTPDQQIRAYRAYLDHTMRHIGGAKALDDLDPDFAHAIADAVFMHGGKGGITAIQEAIRGSGIDPSIEIDGGMGPQTLDALKRANGVSVARDALQNKIADIRQDLKEWKPSELERIGRSRPGAWKR